jgi:endonuclease YncB( thermonuclease family)
MTISTTSGTEAMARHAALLAIVLVFQILFHALPAIAAPADVSGRIVGISDGDTVTLLTAEKRQIRVRLHGIDAPERKQPWGEKAKQALSDLCFGKEATAAYVDTDRYGRMVARIKVDGVDVNAEMVRQGAAWVYRKYTDDPHLLALEDEARSASRGLWSLPPSGRVPPWEWRRTSSSPATRPAAREACGTKRTCAEMSSCAEALHYLTACGRSRLDGDRDGVPCEALCR